jgi:hypothetical protein
MKGDTKYIKKKNVRVINCVCCYVYIELCDIVFP